MSEASKEVGLVFEGVGGFFEVDCAVNFFSLGVVAAGDFIERVVNLLHEKPEFDHAVTHDVGIGRTAGLHFSDRVVDDGVEVLALHGDDFQRDIEVGADLAGVFEVVFPGAIAEELELVFKPNFEIKGLEFVALLFEKL